jgi:glycosyltransferase involved in cell wall biosynthesis
MLTPDEMKSDLTIILLTYNEQHNIPELMSNLEGLDANIFVVDSFSTDQTIPLLDRAGITYVQHVFGNYSLQRNWAQQNNPYNTEWVLHLDADERLTPELKKWIQHSFDPKTTMDGYIFGRRAIFMNKWIKSHYNYHLRLYKVAKGKCETKAYDQHFVVSGNVQVIKNADMESNVCDNLFLFTQSHNKWAMLEAFDILSKGADGEVKSTLAGTPIEKTRWFKTVFFQGMPLFLRSFMYFFYRYIIKLGFLDGTQGFIFCVLQAFWFRFLVDANVFEIKQVMKSKNISLEQVRKSYP